MISLPVHRKISSADEEEWFMAVMEEANEKKQMKCLWLIGTGLEKVV